MSQIVYYQLSRMFLRMSLSHVFLQLNYFSIHLHRFSKTSFFFFRLKSYYYVVYKTFLLPLPLFVCEIFLNKINNFNLFFLKCHHHFMMKFALRDSALLETIASESQNQGIWENHNFNSHDPRSKVFAFNCRLLVLINILRVFRIR